MSLRERTSDMRSCGRARGLSPFPSHYTGAFDGGGHTIYSLSIEPSSDVVELGFFGAIGSGGTVKNLSLDSPSVSATGYYPSYAGGIAGYNAGGTIEDCTSNATITATGEGSYAGGIAGYNDDGTIEGCKNSGTVTAEGDYSCAGGIVGYNYAEYYNYAATVTGCTNSGEVTAKGDNSYAGGIAGCNEYGTVEDCTNASSGTVTAEGDESYAGGIAGINYTFNTLIGTVTGCKNSATVAATGESSYAGGITGYNDGTVEDNTNSGTVSATGTGGNSGSINGNDGAASQMSLSALRAGGSSQRGNGRVLRSR